jgi:hypothetical protein
MKTFKFHGIQIDAFKRKQWEEFLKYTLTKNKKLNFHDFKKNCGISRAQWNKFRELNIEEDVTWDVE